MPVLGTFADAAAFGEIIFNCTAGVASIEALTMAGGNNMNGKIIVDLANPLDFSHGAPPSLSVVNTGSLGERNTKGISSVESGENTQYNVVRHYGKSCTGQQWRSSCILMQQLRRRKGKEVKKILFHSDGRTKISLTWAI